MSAIDAIGDSFIREGFVSFDLACYLPGLDEATRGLDAVDEDVWSFIIKNHLGEFELPISGLDESRRLHQLAEDDLRSGSFSFSFRRLGDNVANDRISSFHNIKKMLSSARMFDLLQQVTKRRPIELLQFYISRFDRGHFLYTHRDPGQSFGIAVNLTRRWDPNHGGLTVILDEDSQSVRACLLPTPYQVLVFDTSARSIPHFVSMVTSSPPWPRLAAVARYDAHPLPCTG